MQAEKIYLSTLSPDAPALAEECGIGLELDHFCTAANMDEGFDAWDAAVRADMRHAERFVLHAPFAELTPCAIDPLIREVSMKRLKQAIALCRRYGVKRMVAHSGFLPRVYFPEWYLDQGAPFFRELLQTADADFELLIENVLEPDPALLGELIERIGDPRAKICLDVGHAFVSSEIPPREWIDRLAPWTRHLHLHDNDGSFDFHLPPGDGKIGYPELFGKLEECVPDATWTFECPDAIGCIRRLRAFGIVGLNQPATASSAG